MGFSDLFRKTPNVAYNYKSEHDEIRAGHRLADELNRRPGQQNRPPGSRCLVPDEKGYMHHLKIGEDGKYHYDTETYENLGRTVGREHRRSGLGAQGPWFGEGNIGSWHGNNPLGLPGIKINSNRFQEQQPMPQPVGDGISPRDWQPEQIGPHQAATQVMAQSQARAMFEQQQQQQQQQQNPFMSQHSRQFGRQSIRFQPQPQIQPQPQPQPSLQFYPQQQQQQQQPSQPQSPMQPPLPHPSQNANTPSIVDPLVTSRLPIGARGQRKYVPGQSKFDPRQFGALDDPNANYEHLKALEELRKKNERNEGRGGGGGGGGWGRGGGGGR